MLFVFRFVIGLLSILINSFRVSNYCVNDETELYFSNKSKAIDIALKLLNQSTQACVQLHSKLLLAVSQPEYHNLQVKITFFKLFHCLIIY